MTRKQEIDALYDRLCWLLKGSAGGAVDPESFSDVISPDGLAQFVCTVDDCWGIRESGHKTLLDSRYIDKWFDLSGLAEAIYEGGGRINRKMTEKKA